VAAGACLMKRRIATVLVEPKTLYREALAHLLSNTSYKPIRIISHISDITHGDLPKADKLLFIIGSESWKGSSSRGEPHTEIIPLPLVPAHFHVR
jgi:hypothetical protein